MLYKLVVSFITQKDLTLLALGLKPRGRGCRPQSPLMVTEDLCGEMVITSKHTTLSRIEFRQRLYLGCLVAIAHIKVTPLLKEFSIAKERTTLLDQKVFLCRLVKKEGHGAYIEALPIPVTVDMKPNKFTSPIKVKTTYGPNIEAELQLTHSNEGKINKSSV